MKKLTSSIVIIFVMLLFTQNIFAAIIIDKNDASQYSKKSPYSTIIDENKQNDAEIVYQRLGEEHTSNNNQSTSSSNENNNSNSTTNSNKATSNSNKTKKGAGFVDNSVEARFSVPKGIKTGNNYSNSWSNYSITFNDTTYNANEYYDFSSEGIQFDFAVYFKDYSRIAVYYSTLSRDLNTIASKFAPGKTPNDQVIAGEIYKHVTYEEPYPYGKLYYDYYLRNVDNKLMVIEIFHEKDNDTALKYLSQFSKKS